MRLGAASAAAQYVVTHPQLSHNPINLDFLLDPLLKSEFLSFHKIFPKIMAGSGVKTSAVPFTYAIDNLLIEYMEDDPALITNGVILIIFQATTSTPLFLPPTTSLSALAHC